jgi:phage gpG-like protein
MANRAIHVDGVDQLRRTLRKLGDDDLKKALKEANKRIADEIIDRALPKVPVRSGRLRQSVRGLGNLAGAVGKAGSAKVPYAAAIHWGRKKGGEIEATPFLWKAAKDMESVVADRYQDEVNEIIRRADRLGS